MCFYRRKAVITWSGRWSYGPVKYNYYGDAKLQENGAVLADYITEGNLALFMTNYTIISVTRDGMIRVVFEDGNYKYEALVTDMAEVAEINIIE